MIWLAIGLFTRVKWSYKIQDDQNFMGTEHDYIIYVQTYKRLFFMWYVACNFSHNHKKNHLHFLQLVWNVLLKQIM